MPDRGQLVFMPKRKLEKFKGVDALSFDIVLMTCFSPKELISPVISPYSNALLEEEEEVSGTSCMDG